MNSPEKPTYFEARKWASFRIQNFSQIDMYDIDFLIQKRFGFSTTDMLIHYHDKMLSGQWLQFQNDVKRLISGEPVQYIVGQANFYGLTLNVDSNVLIPRVETEELVDWILDQTTVYTNRPLKVLDIGTGSGAIAIALKANRPEWQVNASDISESALKVAQQNAQLHHVAINFILSDMFARINEAFDLIVSNPPYISASEVGDMDSSVKNNEPRIALFAADDGLAIYKSLAKGVDAHLNVGGQLFVEIGFHQETSVRKIFQEALPNAIVTAKHDVSGHQRMVRLRKNGE